MAAFLKRVNRTKVPPELIGEVMEMHANLPPEDGSAFEIRTVRIFELLAEKGFKGPKHAGLAVAVEFRITTLARLLASQEVRGWSLPGVEPGQENIHADVVSAAAEEPIIETADHQAGFDPESFRKRVLALAEAKGHA